MKALHYLLGGLLFLALVGAALLLLSIGFQGEEPWAQLVAELSERRIEAIFVALGVALTVLLYALTALRLPEKARYLAYDIEGGNVSISLAAVENFLARLTGEFAALSDLKPSVKASQGAVDVQLDVKVKAGAQIPELCRMLQERARETIREKVGISEVREVRVRVQEITGELTSGKRTAPEEKPETFG